MKYKILATAVFLAACSLTCAAVCAHHPRFVTTLQPIEIGCLILGLALVGLYLLKEIEDDSL